MADLGEYPEAFPLAVNRCGHRHLRPERYSRMTICLDCGVLVCILPAQFIVDEGRKDQVRHVWRILNQW